MVRHSADESEADVVIVVQTRSQVQGVLDAWGQLLVPYSLIFVEEEHPDQDDNDDDEDGNPLQDHGRDHLQQRKYFTKRDAHRFLATLPPPKKPRATSIAEVLLNPFKANACRSFGMLASKRRYIYTFDAATITPAQDPAATSQAYMDVAAQHLANLRTPSTPYFFNTLYDPFQEGSAGFVRGYPFSLRLGVTTVVSHGLTLGIPDYDAPTAIVKPHERTTRVVDAVVTVPQNALFPMSAANLAFDRRRIGACMLLCSNVGGSAGGIDDVWAGLCAKVTADHLGFGVKTGLPYVRRGASTPAGPLASLRSDFKPLLFLEEVIPFFQALRLPRSATTAEECYLEIARTVRHKLRSLDPSFEMVAASMEAWADAWKAANQQQE